MNCSICVKGFYFVCKYVSECEGGVCTDVGGVY